MHEKKYQGLSGLDLFVRRYTHPGEEALAPASTRDADES